MSDSKVLIAVIAFNEEKNISMTLRDLYSQNYDIIVVDDGSNDATIIEARKSGVEVIRHSVNTGNGMATVNTYLSYAARHNYDVVCQFDGDGQHLASELPSIIEPILKGKSEYVIGSRFIENEGFQSFFLRRIAIRFFSRIVSRIVGKRITDVTSGFRAYSGKLAGEFDSRCRQEIDNTVELLLICHFMGAKILEVPVRMKPRLHGVSEFTLTKSMVFPFKCAISIVGVLVQQVNAPWK